MNFPRYIRTLRHLRLSQMIGQVRVRLAQRFMDPSVVKSREWRLDDRKLLLNLSAPVPAQDARALVTGRFEFVGEQVDSGSSPDWEAAGQSRLWKYNLHYFDWLWSLLDAADDYWGNAKDLTLDWIERHPPTKGACGWEPYPTSLRLMNWCLLYGWKHQEKLAEDPIFRDTLLDSISHQVAWLERNLETHIQANHLLENLCALMCVSSVLKGPDCTRLQNRYGPKLAREIQEQILPDGMHYERSPMYHLRVMWLMEMINEVGDPYIHALVEVPLNRAKMAVASLRHPDGDIAQFNDSALGIYNDSWQIESSIGSWSLPDAGYFGIRSAEKDYLIIDAGAIGPDHQPGHAHADLLSFELSLAGQRVITDTGIGTYEIGSQRSYDRSTAAHSTVEVAGENSVEVWSGFRVGRRVIPKILRWEPRGDECLLEVEHHGYHHLQSKAIHRRAFQWVTGKLIISDEVTIKKPVEVIGRIHLDPKVIAKLEGKKVSCVISKIGFTLEVTGPGELSLEERPVFTHFGKENKRQVVIIRTTASPPILNWTWRLTRG
tara:strand:- start:2566 stop:4206 length:1641 start_codon:yes stop_codon:yes gene_type:complete